MSDALNTLTHLRRIEELRELHRPAIDAARAEKATTAAKISDLTRKIAARQYDDKARVVPTVEEWEARQQAQENWRNCGVGTKHRLALKFEHWEPAEQATLNAIRAVIAKGGIAALVGPRGTGKTQAAARLCYGSIFAHRTALYRVFADMLEGIRAQSIDGEGSELSRVKSAGLLCIDEMHERRWTEDESLWLHRLLDHRYRENRATILIANLMPDAMLQLLGPSVRDRMREGGGAGVYELTGPSRRRSEA